MCILCLSIDMENTKTIYLFKYNLVKSIAYGTEKEQ